MAIGNAVEVELGERRGGDQKSNVEISTLDPNEGKRTDEIAAQKAGFGSKDTYRQAKKVVETATPELVEAMDSGRVKPSVAAKIADLPPAEPLIAARAKERQESGINQHSLVANLPPAETGKTRDELATMSGVSASNISKELNVTL